MDATESTYRIVASVAWVGPDGHRQGAYYGYWTPKDDMSHLEQAQAFVRDKHEGALGLEVWLYMVEDVTGTDPQRVSVAANSIGYALQEAGVELSTESILNAAQRLADQGLLK